MAKVNKYEWIIGEKLPDIDEHSIVKLEILERYIEIYLRYLSNNPFQSNLKLNIIDGFSGGGIYKDNILGSPLRIRQTIEKTKKIISFEREQSNCMPINFDIDYRFIEKKKNTHEFLKYSLKEYGLFCDKTKCILGKFTTHLDSIISETKEKTRSGRSIFILDQYGYADAPIKSIRKIFKELSSTEVILTFSIDSLIDYLTKENTKVLENQGLTKEECERIFDEREDTDFSRAKIQPILYKIIVEQVGAPFYTPFFIKSDVSNRAYWLFHFSTHPTARDEMMKLHWEKQNSFIHYGGAGLKMLIGYNSEYKNNLFKNEIYEFNDFAKEKSIDSLSKEIPRMIHSAKETTFESLKNTIINQTPVTENILRESLSESLESGEIEIRSADKLSKRKKFTTIKKDDFLIWRGQKQLSFFN